MHTSCFDIEVLISSYSKTCYCLFSTLYIGYFRLSSGLYVYIFHEIFWPNNDCLHFGIEFSVFHVNMSNRTCLPLKRRIVAPLRVNGITCGK